MLAHAQPIKVLSTFGTQEQQPQNSTDTVVFRRALPIDANANNAPSGIDPSQYLLQEGVTPSARSIQYQDVTAVLQQYGVLLKLSSKVEATYEDDVPNDMTQLVGEHMGSLEEAINYGVVKGGTSVVFANGLSRTSVNTTISLNRLRQCARQLELAHASLVTKKLASGSNFGTSAISPAYLVFVHTDVEADIRNLPGFVPVYEYASGAQVHDREIGACERFRFVSSPYFRPWLQAGAAAGTAFLSNGGSGGGNADVYPCLVVAQDAYAQVALKGMGAIDPIYIPAKEKNHANPMGQFGYVGAQIWKTAVRLNESWMVRLEVAASAL
jgi:N4-gp56 family major capsid protein